MREMKENGIPWIGKIPKKWNTIRIKYIAKLNGRIGWQGLTAQEYQDEGPFLITGIDFKNGNIDWEHCYHVSQNRWKQAPEIQIKNKDLLITKDGTVGKLAYVQNLTEKATLNSGVLKIAVEKKGFYTKFLFWVLQSEVFWKWFKIKNAGNSTILHLYQNDFKEFKYPYPDLYKQKAIADYLDAKCADIDALQQDLQAEIETLQAYKKSLITRAVTKGLDPHVEMKDSRIPWVKRIPKHWEVKRLKFIMDNFDYERIPVDATKRNQDSDQLYDYYGASGIIDKIDGYTSEGTRILIGEDGANLVLRNLPVIYIAHGKYWVNNHAHILAPKENGNLYFYAYQMECVDYTEYITGSAQPKLSQKNLGQVYLVVPPINEQNTIAGYLDSKCSEIDSIIASKQKQSEILSDYKKSLIYEMVTGKKEVPVHE